MIYAAPAAAPEPIPAPQPGMVYAAPAAAQPVYSMSAAPVMTTGGSVSAAQPLMYAAPAETSYAVPQVAPQIPVTATYTADPIYVTGPASSTTAMPAGTGGSAAIQTISSAAPVYTTAPAVYSAPQTYAAAPIYTQAPVQYTTAPMQYSQYSAPLQYAAAPTFVPPGSVQYVSTGGADLFAKAGAELHVSRSLRWTPTVMAPCLVRSSQRPWGRSEASGLASKGVKGCQVGDFGMIRVGSSEPQDSKPRNV